ncbi:DNA repair protein RecO [Thalassovita gelatinovora]|uniref:DNA repair protein RecO n=1 Tax=Thalassovita gelatinovora TaxID=53501 RepID=A0A0P1FEQ1_THAGE|nr:DNA repair protein RecO [Thalassovita gelatinovora]QIZ81471.1 DNA repair protein RecO [Thalassovita gelatinovora]CUH66303.1 DNA repair protein RecO [Thalassovita gelatinovora]SEQ23352.1 DNA replication and repair protein RecO [Thalassovita gelatinovora]
MEWRDQGILLAVRRHGENSAILELFTPVHGRHAGVMRGATSRKIAPVLQPGAQLDVTWKARLADHIGSYTVEPLRSRAAMVMADRQALAGLNAVCAMLLYALPEREAHLPLYKRTEALLDVLDETGLWPLAYLRWELALLDELGYGLDLSTCAVVGTANDLSYISPKTGRAVSRAGAGDWADRLLPLPPCLLGGTGFSGADILQGLEITEFFLRKSLAEGGQGKPIPQARQRFVDQLVRGLAQRQNQIDQ